MKKVTYKFILDIVLAVTIATKMDEWSVLGIAFHETVGLVLCLFYILHIVLNWNFVKGVTLSFGKVARKNQINYVLDVLLLLCFTLVIVSGMALAKYLDFAWLGFKSSRFWMTMHVSGAMIIVMLVGIHVGLHWDWVLTRFRWSKWGNPKLRKVLSMVLVMIIVVGAGYSYEKVDFGRRTMVFFNRNEPIDPESFTFEGDVLPTPELAESYVKEGELVKAIRMYQYLIITNPEVPGFYEREEELKLMARPDNLWRHGMTGKLVYWNNVMLYIPIFAFFLMVSRYLDVLFRKGFRPKSSK